jgi:hypothetical protein
MLLKSRSKRITVGPDDHGRRMSLDDFDKAIGCEGYCYELNKGVIEVSDIPHPNHLALLQEVRSSLVVYHLGHPETIHSIAGSGESKILLAADQSERHPDLSVYFDRPPDIPDVWSLWVPEIVVEVISKNSIKRDYEDKPGEYLSFGVTEYWIIDGFKNQMTVLTRWRGQWKDKIVKAPRKYSTPLLSGFLVDLKRVFAAAK